VAPHLAEMVRGPLGYKFHWAVSDYLQRSARHIASKVDVEQAYAVGKAAVEMALAGVHGKLPVIVRTSDALPLEGRPGRAFQGGQRREDGAEEIHHPDGFHITEACRRYLAPLIQGEDYPPYKNGMPKYVKLQNQLAAKKLPPWEG
jgi:ATP-dependent phosphofructokinase / diphosphate-dependent phosphofructokinase